MNGQGAEFTVGGIVPGKIQLLEFSESQIASLTPLLRFQNQETNAIGIRPIKPRFGEIMRKAALTITVSIVGGAPTVKALAVMVTKRPVRHL